MQPLAQALPPVTSQGFLGLNSSSEPPGARLVKGMSRRHCRAWYVPPAEGTAGTAGTLGYVGAYQSWGASQEMGLYNLGWRDIYPQDDDV